MDIDLVLLSPLSFTLYNRIYIYNIYYTVIETEIDIESGNKLETNIITDMGTDIEDIVNSNNSEDFDPIGAEDNQINMNMD